MGVIGWIVVGLVAGGLARRVTGTKRVGCGMTTATGVLGGLIGGALFNAAGDEGIGEFGLRSMLVAFIGATLLLSVLAAITGRSPRR